MPHLHELTDHAFGFTVGLSLVELAEYLAYAVHLTGLEEGMLVGALVFLAVFGIDVINPVRAFGDDVIGQELGGAFLPLVGQDVGIVSSREKSSMDTNKYSRG